MVQLAEISMLFQLWMQGITGKGVVVSVVDDGKSIFMHCLFNMKPFHAY